MYDLFPGIHLYSENSMQPQITTDKRWHNDKIKSDSLWKIGQHF